MSKNEPTLTSANKAYSSYSELFWVFVSVVVIYTFFYLKQPALPGNDLAHPEGWWGWFDQGQYLREAKAFLHHDLNPANYFYPPLYPFFGAIFIALGLNQHPFFFIDGLAYGIFASLSFAVVRRYFSLFFTSAILAITVVFNGDVLENFAIPWTSSITCLAYAGSFFILAYQISAKNQLKSPSRVILSSTLMGLLFGLVALTRPVDAALAPIFFLALLYINSTSTRHVSFNLRSGLLTSGILGGIFLLAIATLLIFNKWIFHAYFGGYFNSTVGESGYFPSELFRKLFTLLRDGYTVNLERGSSLTTHFPWVILSGLGMIYAFVRRDLLLCTISLVILGQLCIYAPYGDLLPNGIWRFHNIHYFKWMFPFLGLLALFSLRETFKKEGFRPRWRIPVKIFGLLVYLTAVMGVHYSQSTQDVKYVASTGPASIDLTMPKEPTDFIDIQGITGSFTSIYFGNHQIMANGRPLEKVKDFRMLPAPWGIRIVFNKPTNVERMNLRGDPSLSYSSHYLVRRGTYYFSFGLPKLFLDK